MRSRNWRWVAELGLAHWFFGNLYEAAVDVPLLLARGGPTGVLGRGSPVRYYLAPAPVTVAATAVTVLDGWRSGDDRRALLTSGAGVVAAAALTAHLVRTVNIPLLHNDSPVPAGLRAHWHRVNIARLAALAVTVAGLRYSAGHHVASSDHR